MLRFLLRLFPRSFVEQMGEEWLLDTREELRLARAKGSITQCVWLIRTVLGCIRGASTARLHALSVALKTQTYTIAVGDKVAILQQGSHIPPGIWSATLLGMGGILLAGHLSANLFLSLWVEGGADGILKIFQDYGLGLHMIGLGPVAAQLAGVVLGLVLVVQNRIKSNVPGVSWLHLGYVVFMFSMAFSSSFIVWTLRDLGSLSKTAVQSFEDYPTIKKQMGFDFDAEPGDFQATAAQCKQASAVLELASSRWISSAREVSDLVPLILLKGLGAQMWKAGCWTTAQLLEQDKALIAASLATDLQLRRMKFQMLGKMEESRAQILPSIPLTRTQMCHMEIARQTKGAASPKAIHSFCASIPKASQPVSRAGIYKLPKDPLN